METQLRDAVHKLPDCSCTVSSVSCQP